MNNKLIEVKPAQNGEYQISLKSMANPNHIGMYTMYSLTAFESEEDINEFITALEYVRDLTYHGKASIS
jgi:hypothetical protein